MRTLSALALAALLVAGPALAQTRGSGSGSGSGSGATPMPPQPQSPLPTGPGAGQPDRIPTGLTEQEVADLEAGRGMGFALAAELNGFPGPLHVVEHADVLKLTPDQRAKVQAAYDWMKGQAEGLGRRYIEAETALAASFRRGAVTAHSLAEHIKAVEAIRAELRHVHLSAHIETAALLSDQQKAVYEALRSYIRGRRPAEGTGFGSDGGQQTGGAMCRPGAGAAGGGCCCAGGGCGGTDGSMSCRPRR